MGTQRRVKVWQHLAKDGKNCVSLHMSPSTVFLGFVDLLFIEPYLASRRSWNPLEDHGSSALIT